MNLMQRMAPVPAVLCAAMALWWFGGDWVPWIAGAAAIIGVPVKQRIRLDVIGQLIVVLFTAALTYAYYFLLNEPPSPVPGRLSVIGQMGALFCIGVTTFRLWVEHPAGREVVTAIVTIAGWLFMGLGTRSEAYLSFAAVGILLAITGARRAQFSGRAQTALSSMRMRHGMLTVAMIVISAVIAAMFIIAIPKVYGVIESRFLNSLAFAATGFSPAMKLGSVNHMFVSEDIVLRVFTTERKTRHLRGVVYNTYNDRYWTNTIPRQFEPAPAMVHEKGAGRQRLMRIKAADTDSRLFAPLNTAGVQAGRSARIDMLGLVSTPPDVEIDRYGILLSNSADDQRVAPPVSDDVAVSESLQRPLTQWISTHVADGLNTAQKLVAIESALQQNYRYSLTFERPESTDALLNFLQRNRVGHCEYFASAFALLARVAGVPTRVAGGYLLKEYNPYGQYYIVRSKHAHVWTEVWMNHRWHTIDPTPATIRDEQVNRFSNAFDYAGVWLLNFKESVLQTDRRIIAVIIVTLFGIWGVVIWHRRRRRTQIVNTALGYGDAHPVLLQMETMLTPILPRNPSETIEDWANRLTAHSDTLKPAAALLHQYAAWRYGGVGDVDVLAQRIQQLTR